MIRIPSISWVAFMVTMLVCVSILTPRFVTIYYTSPCTDPGRVESLLPMVCRVDVSYRAEGDSIIANISGSDIVASRVSGSEIVVVNSNAWELFLACCLAKYPLERQVDFYGVFKAVGISFAIAIVVLLLTAKVFAGLRRTHHSRSIP